MAERRFTFLIEGDLERLREESYESSLLWDRWDYFFVYGSGMLAALSLRDGMGISYVCATRGEGGQNEIGPELYEDLAVIRTREMQAAAEIGVQRMGGFQEVERRGIEIAEIGAHAGIDVGAEFRVAVGGGLDAERFDACFGPVPEEET